MEHQPKSFLTICGVSELNILNGGKFSHIISLVDPEYPEISDFDSFRNHRRTIIKFHDIIECEPGKIAPTQEHIVEILRFGSAVSGLSVGQVDGQLLVHCHMGVSRSTAATLSLLAQAYPDWQEDYLFETLRQIRPQAWPNSLMISHADTLLAREGRLMAALSRHYSHQIKNDPYFYDWMSRLGRTRELEMALNPHAPCLTSA
ncbi:MAG TPA: protein-tyrosine-phosphatase [Azospirillum sp.]|nr:protein-tyrosine-phosphatase [Azospirillum sp.]